MHRVQLGLLLSALIAGCDSAARESKPAPAPTPPAVTTTTPASTPVVAAVPVSPEPKPAAKAEPWGTVKGRLVWGDKEMPKRPAVTVPSTHNDHKFCTKDGEFLEDACWVVDPKSKGLKDVFVWLAPAEPDGKLAIHPSRQKIADNEKTVVIDQPVCMFIPHALVVREGQTLLVKNSAKVSHSFKWGGGDPNPGGNKLIEAGGQMEVEIKPDRLLVQVDCALHNWMKAAILAVDHPYAAVTDAQGRFEIKDAPAGPCRLMIRHNTGFWSGGAKGKNGKAITIQAGDNDLGTLEYLPPN